MISKVIGGGGGIWYSYYKSEDYVEINSTFYESNMDITGWFDDYVFNCDQ